MNYLNDFIKTILLAICWVAVFGLYLLSWALTCSLFGLPIWASPVLTIVIGLVVATTKAIMRKKREERHDLYT